MYALRSLPPLFVNDSGRTGTASHTLPVLMYRETFEEQLCTAQRLQTSSCVSVVLILPITYYSNRKK